MTGRLYWLARLCVRHRLPVLAAWLAATVALVAASHTLGETTSEDLSLPGTDSQAATDTLAKAFPNQANGSSPIVLHVAHGKLTEPRYAHAVNEAVAAVAKAPHVAAVVSPLTPQGATALSKNQATGYLSVTLDESPGDLSVDEAHTIIDATHPAQAAGLQVETGGQLGQKVSKPATEVSEVIGIVAAMVILTFAFGTLAAMLLPIINAVVALLAALAIVRLLGHVTTVPSVAPTLATMIGLGVGIDYALFIVTRHFRGLSEGLDYDESIARAAATSGGAVFFAGSTVTIALVSLAVAGIPLVTTMGLMAGIAVVVAVLAALTLLPAVLALLGPRINAGRVRPPHRDLRPEAATEQGVWARWANSIARHPLLAGMAALAILIPLMIPLLSLNLGQQDNGALSTSTTARRAYDLISENFGSGVNGPLLIAVSLGSPAKAPSQQPAGQQPASHSTSASSSRGDPRAGDPRLQTLQHDIATTAGVANVSPINIDKAGTTAYFNAIATTAPSDKATEELVQRLRADAIPNAEHGTDMKAHVGGSTAGYVDLAARISEKLLLQIAVVIALSFVLLILAFRTIMIPAQAAVMNLLSIAAAYGVLTAIFQYGWLSGLIGLEGPVPVVSYVPLFMFAVLFGLSMDYEVFLVSQIEEHVNAGQDNRQSVVSGLVTSARVITSAAFIMVFVFGSFVLNGDPTVKQFGVGLAVAVVLDATVVRCLLVPALMLLMGRVNWWMPSWLGRIVPHTSIEGAEFFRARDEPLPQPTSAP
ncbi:MAG TPA: MMPL family transporter [Solirubrobacteraceae bacterium]|jgi:RND superfamily putative drug exporter|nr:MMPL family transporter [Solirubrobacteraceae bacterium]